MRRPVALILVGALVSLAACSSSSSHQASPRPATTSTSRAPTTTAPATPDPQVWLCKPDKADDPCLSSMTADVVAPDGTKTVQKTSVATDPKIDCFYVYPTVSKQKGPNASLAIDPAEVSVAIAQASRFSHVCRVFAPMYRQVTLSALFRARGGAAAVIAFNTALSAWKDYLARYNNGRGVVLIGHSQGTLVLRRLISKYVDPNPAVRRRIVSAILLGGNVVVPAGKDVGGDFKHIPACRRASQVGCVIAFSSFDETPPPGAFFGRAKSGEQVLCTNPAALAGGSAPLDPYLPARLGRGPTPPDAPEGTPPSWLNYPNLFTGECKNEGGASWLQITDVRKPGDNRPRLVHSLPASWGLHLYDGQIALGNLVGVVQSEAAAYAAKG